MWLEQQTEGSRNQRIRRDKAPWSPEKVFRKITKHGSWLFVGFITGLTFVGYFYPVKDLFRDLSTLNLSGAPLFWIFFFTFATYINAGWMREQVCMYMCPYARFQSVMFDSDTLIVSYDKNRGDPRGSRKRDADYKELELGECIDCELCVQVCPTGIDIRDGLQYECIGCALCVDACDSVMDKMQYPRGLIRYTSEHELGGGTTHWLRPRVIGYVVVLCLMTGVFCFNLISRIPLELTIIRDRNQLYITTDSGAIDNIYTLQLVNMDPDMHEFKITISGIESASIIGETSHTLNGGEVRSISLRVRVEPGVLDKPSTELDFQVIATDMPSLQATSESRFLKPL
jgi:cytochrome c oxidase accessory protein FixG